jgi:hypothetical protein
MTSPGRFSARHSIPTPGDGQDEPADGETKAVTIADPSAVNWGDALQTWALDDKYLDGKLVDAGTLGGRSAAGADAPRFYVVTDGGDDGGQVYLSYNDDAAWHKVGDVALQTAIDDTDSPYAISNGESVWVDASGAAVTVTLPEPTGGQDVRVVVVDATNTVTLSQTDTTDSNGNTVQSTIDGSTADKTITTERGVALESDATGWRTTADTRLDVAAIAGAGLKDDGSNTLTVEPTDFAGTALADDGADNFEVNIGTFLSTDANGALQVDLGNGVKDDGAGNIKVEPAHFAGTGLSDDGVDNLQVNLGTGVKTDGSDNLTVEPTDFAGAGLVDDGADNLEVQERLNYSPGHTEWADGLADEEVMRIVPGTGAVTVEALAFHQKGGGGSTSADLDIYDAGAATELASVTLGSTDRTTYTAGAGNTVLVRVANATGGPIDATPVVRGYID